MTPQSFSHTTRSPKRQRGPSTWTGTCCTRRSNTRGHREPYQTIPPSRRSRADTEKSISSHQVVNLWRPIENPAWHRPLALADYRSVRKQDLLVHNIVFPTRKSETWHVLENPEHQWKYVSGMATNEYVLFKWYVKYHSHI
jgi:hypothetical protein